MKKKVNGFTMIEIVLVLAIAGAIFAAIFIALSGVWADERDNERRADVMTFIRELKNFQTNNARGALPGSTGSDKTKLEESQDSYIEITFKDDGTEKRNTSDKNSDVSWYSFYTGYFDKDFTDPDGPRYNLRVAKCKYKTGNPDTKCTSNGLDSISSGTFGNNEYAYTLFVVTEAVCDGEDAKQSANLRNVAVLYRMEAGGVYCENT